MEIARSESEQIQKSRAASRAVYRCFRILFASREQKALFMSEY
jgi:hypothetical protein